ncbi:hypothetical protein AOLI_G00114320 [Acnodon oligacanthus]
MCSPSALSCLLQQTILRFLHSLSLLKKAWLGSPLIAMRGSGYADWSQGKRSVQAESRRCSPGEAGSRSGESDRQVLIKASSRLLMAWGNGGLLDTLLSSSPRAAWVMGRWGTVGSAAPLQYDSGLLALKMVNMRESQRKIVRDGPCGTKTPRLHLTLIFQACPFDLSERAERKQSYSLPVRASSAFSH